MTRMDQDISQPDVAVPAVEPTRRRPRVLIIAVLALVLVSAVAVTYFLTRDDASSSAVTTSSDKQAAAIGLARTLVPEVAGSTDAQLAAVGRSTCALLAEATDQSTWAAMVRQDVAKDGLTQFHAAQLIDLMVRGFCPAQSSKIVDTFSP
jgi:hypothetical protein